MPHGKYPSPLLVGDFLDEEKQNRLGVEKINLEVLEIENHLKSIVTEEKQFKKSKDEIIDKQNSLKVEHSQVLMQITEVRAQIRDEVEDTQTIEEMTR